MPLRFATPAPSAYQAPLTIRHLLDGLLVRAGDQEIVYRDERRFTYRETIGRIGRLASMLEAAGASAGTTVAVMDWDSHRYLEAYFAVPMMGAVLQTVNVRLPAPQIAYTLEHAQATVLLVHQDFFPLVEELLPSLPGIRAVIAITDGAAGELPHYAIGEYEALSAAASPNYPFEDFDENAVATTFYTTGTTGNPKGVCFSHRQLVLHTLATCGPFGASTLSPSLGGGDVYMPLTPMFHVHAWGMPYVATMLGLKQVYPGRYDAVTICQLRAEHNVTFSHCVPTILEMVLEAAERENIDLRGWKMRIGGSALSIASVGRARRRGMDVAVGYGMSETAPIITLASRPAPTSPDDEVEAIALIRAGTSVPLVEVRIVDEEMNDVVHDGQARGELVLRAPWLTVCYTGDEQASVALWRGGWLHTQDIATIDAMGVVQLRDRIKDVIKTGGEWIDSIQLEQLVATAHGVAEASVVAIPDERWGERPLAVIVAVPGASPNLEAINAPIKRAITNGEITPYAKLDRFEVVEALPRTSVGKIDKKALRQLYAIH